jgi:hypothetical protein
MQCLIPILILGFCILLRVLYQEEKEEEPSLATTLQGVYLYLFRRYMFPPLLAIFRRNTQYFREVASVA